MTTAYSGSIAEYYDRCLGPAYFGPMADELAGRVPSSPEGGVLELACGTGLMTRTLHGRLDPAVRLVATDLGKGMLDFARGQSPNAARIEWREADMTRLPFADGEFGVVACAFGVMFPPDKPALFAEIRRVLRDGGSLFFSVWDRIEQNPHALAIAEAIESFFPGDPEMRWRVPYEMHDPGRLERHLADAGFTGARIETHRHDVVGVSARTLAIGAVRGTPRSLLFEKRGASLDTMVDRLTAALARVGGADPYRGPAQALMVGARR